MLFNAIRVEFKDKEGKRIEIPLCKVVKDKPLCRRLGIEEPSEIRPLRKGSRILAHGSVRNYSSRTLDLAYNTIYGDLPRRKDGWTGDPETQKFYYPKARR